MRARRVLADRPAAPCAYCGGSATEWDHVVPLSRGGLDYRWNMVPACVPCNRAKGRQMPWEMSADASPLDYGLWWHPAWRMWIPLDWRLSDGPPTRRALRRLRARA